MDKCSEVPHRPLLTNPNLQQATLDMQLKMFKCLDKKGYGAWLSSHEILGIITEEYKELVDAVHSGTKEQMKQELLDVAVGCVFAGACIQQDTLDW